MSFNQYPRAARLVCAAAAAAVAASVTPAALAAPYASGVVQDGSNVSFILNETADSLVVHFNTGGMLELDPTRGTKAFTLQGGATAFDIVATKEAEPGYLQGVLQQISDDSNIFNRFARPQGLAVNQDPSTPYFGRIYVANSHWGFSPSGVPIEGVSERFTLPGMYLLNADQSDALGHKDDPSTGGHFFLHSAATPFRLWIGDDNNLYLTDWSLTATGGLAWTDPDVITGGRVLFGNHTAVSAVVVTGSQAGEDLTVWTMDEFLDPNNRSSLQRYDIGDLDFPYEGERTHLTSEELVLLDSFNDLDRLSDGRLILSQHRLGGMDAASIYIVGDNGAVLWDSLAETRRLESDEEAADLLRGARSIALSPDEAFLAVGHNDGTATLVPLEDGVPDLENRMVLELFPGGFVREMAFDIAGNLYAVNSLAQLMRVFAPGGLSIATTGSDGTFRLGDYEPPPPFLLLPGDANRDGRVDGEDFLIWQANFGTEFGAIWDDADFNGDGRVDGEDFLIWQAHFGMVAESSVVTPEPAALSLLALSGAGLLLRRRRV